MVVETLKAEMEWAKAGNYIIPWMSNAVSSVGFVEASEMQALEDEEETATKSYPKHCIPQTSVFG